MPKSRCGFFLNETGAPAIAALPRAAQPGLSDRCCQRPWSSSRTDPISLNDPAMDGGTELLGASACPGAARRRQDRRAISWWRTGSPRRQSPAGWMISPPGACAAGLEQCSDIRSGRRTNRRHEVDVPLSAARRSIPSETRPPTAPPAVPRGSPRRPATGRAAYRRRRTACRRWCGSPAHWPSHCRARRA